MLLSACSASDESIDGSLAIDSAIDASMIAEDASTRLPCDTPGVAEHVPCGACGMVERFCSAARVWVYAECTGEGECRPGARDERECGMCGTQPMTCTAQCTWEASGECRGGGVCAPGTTTRISDGCPEGSTREATCTDACALSPIGECADDRCDTPGVTETTACGRCGSQTRFCTVRRVWEYGLCEDEGECVAGTTRSMSCGMCGTAIERCDATCSWISESCRSEGICEPGTMMRTSEGCPLGQERQVLCSSACMFEALGGCSMPSVDAGIDGGRDAGVDAGRDAGTGDAGRDAGLDAGRDAGIRDAGRDAGDAGDGGLVETSISAIQRGEVPVGTRVLVRSVMVTAVRFDMFWVQDSNFLGAAAYSGVKVYTGTMHGVTRGSWVSIEGTVAEYFGETEISNAIATPTPPWPISVSPLSLTVAQAASEAYEGVLVRLTDVTSHEWPHDCRLDEPTCPDTDLWSVNGTDGLIVHNWVYEDDDWLSRVGSRSVTGIISWRFGRWRILPRTSADLQ